MENKDKITDVPNNNIKENNNPNLQSQEQKIGTPGIERASFSQIFNVASEEQPLEQSKVEIPKIDLPEMKQQPPREKKKKFLMIRKDYFTK